MKKVASLIVPFLSMFMVAAIAPAAQSAAPNPGKSCKPGEIGTRSEASTTYERPSGSRMRAAMSGGVFGDAMTRAEIMRSRS